ncbi:MAG: cupin domain-containing protein [Armatimonadetes bacterium]|nr:cupin domain-containing protein [Armatimonadota bacterium]
MTVKDAMTVEPQSFAEIKGVTVRWLIGENDGAPNFYMRLFELQPASQTPWHHHPWEHEVFVLEGEGFVKSEQGEQKLVSGTVVFVRPNEWHQFRAHPEKPLKFLCLIPASGACALPKCEENS